MSKFFKTADIYYGRIEKKRFLRKGKPVAHVMARSKEDFARQVSALKKKNKKFRLEKLKGGAKVQVYKTKNKKQDVELVMKALKAQKSAREKTASDAYANTIERHVYTNKAVEDLYAGKYPYSKKQFADTQIRAAQEGIAKETAR